MFATSSSSGGGGGNDRLQALINHTYGPYPIEALLQDDIKPAPADKRIHMDSFALYSGDTIVGFDDTEYIITPPESSIAHERHPKHAEITFCGVVEIKHLSWLSDTGKKYLERDVRNQDKKSGIKHAKEFQETFTLQQLCNSTKQNLKVQIVCKKILLAHYMTSTVNHFELVVYAKSKDAATRRPFIVDSLQAITRAHSLKFLGRWTLRAIIVELIELDPKKTPWRERNIDWIVDNYAKIILPRDLELERRQKLRPAGPFSAEPRHPRHIPASQLYGMFAEHAEWLLANQIASGLSTGKHNQLIHVPSWISWCQLAHNLSVDAKNNGVKWGSSESLRLRPVWRKSELGRRLALYGQNEEFWATKLMTWNKAAEKEAENLAMSKSVPSEETKTAAEKRPVQHGGLEYDSDFSPDDYSSSEWSDSSNEPDKNRKRYEYFCHRAPSIPVGHFIWRCPGEGCPKVIDLLNVSAEDSALLPEDLSKLLASKWWRSQDLPIRQALGTMVNHHYLNAHEAPPKIARGAKGKVVNTRGAKAKAVKKDAAVTIKEEE